MSAGRPEMPFRPATRPWAEVDAPLLDWRTRLDIAVARARRWEFWPAWLFYPPIVVWILLLGLRHRSATAFTAANPGIEAGGVVGERKHRTLGPLQRNAPDLVAPFERLPAEPGPRIAGARRFLARVGYPVVLKPNVGQRGRGVFVARSERDLVDYLARFDGDVLIQRWVGGEEFGVFVALLPGESTPRVLSVVHKTFPAVRGDGRSSLYALILADARARLIAPALLRRWRGRLDSVPGPGEHVALVEVGAHCRGSLFLDARQHVTPELRATLARLLAAVPGFAFGRIDLRTPTVADLRAGRHLQVLEVNGVAAESAHIYHPDTPLLDGYRAMFEQWRIAFEIGSAHLRDGARATPALELLRLWREDRARERRWF